MGIDPLRRFDEVADEVARTIDDGKATDLLLLSPPTSPDLSAARRARQPARGQEAGGRGAVSPAMVARAIYSNPSPNPSPSLNPNP